MALSDEQIQALATKIRSDPAELAKLTAIGVNVPEIGQRPEQSTAQVAQAAQPGTISPLARPEIPLTGIAQGQQRLQQAQSERDKLLATTATIPEKTFTKLAISERLKDLSPDESREAIEFLQSQENIARGEVERVRRAEEVGRIVTDAEGKPIEILPPGFEERPTGRTETGTLETEIKPTAEKVGQEQATVDLIKQVAKGRIKSKRDLLNSKFKIGNTFDSWLDTTNKTFVDTGIRPGVVSGAITSVTGRTKQNPFFEGFKGGLTEYAASIAKVAMPSSRAVRLIDLFKPTAPTEFSSIVSGIDNGSRSWKNAVSTDLADVLSGAQFDPPGLKEYQDKIQVAGGQEQFLETVEQGFKEGMVVRVLDKNPNLITDEEQVQLLGGVILIDKDGNKALVDPRDNTIIKELE